MILLSQYILHTWQMRLAVTDRHLDPHSSHMSSSMLKRLNPCAEVTSHLGLGIMVHHYKFIIHREVWARNASDDRPHAPLSRGFYTWGTYIALHSADSRDYRGRVGWLLEIIRNAATFEKSTTATACCGYSGSQQMSPACPCIIGRPVILSHLQYYWAHLDEIWLWEAIRGKAKLISHHRRKINSGCAYYYL
jgi:hypothetical protein